MHVDSEQFQDDTELCQIIAVPLMSFAGLLSGGGFSASVTKM
jgi:hypothetical protein